MEVRNAELQEPDAPTEPADTEKEPPTEEQAAGSGEAEALRKRVEELEAQVEAAQAQYLRALADYQNFRRRTDEQAGEIRRFAAQGIVADLLSVIDNFERALVSAKTTANFDGLVSGLELTLRQLMELLGRHGVEPIEAVGKEFDPTLHEAVGRVADSDLPPNTVHEELQRGYRMHQRVLRPAIVRVVGEE
jgi:molecular chaperone GrpE